MGILTYCIIGFILIFAIIGFLTVIRFLFRGKKKGKKDPYKEWIKTGKT